MFNWFGNDTYELAEPFHFVDLILNWIVRHRTVLAFKCEYLSEVFINYRINIMVDMPWNPTKTTRFYMKDKSEQNFKCLYKF